MKRIANWNVVISESVGSCVGGEFIWGKTDCASLLRTMSVGMYGVDIFSDYVKRKYSTEIGAIRCYKESGSFDSIIKKAGGVEIPSAVIRDGDIAVEQSNDGRFENIIMRVGSKWIMASSEHGTVESHRDVDFDNLKIYRI